MVHSPNGHGGQGRARSSSQVSHAGAGPQHPAVFHCFPRCREPGWSSRDWAQRSARDLGSGLTGGDPGAFFSKWCFWFLDYTVNLQIFFFPKLRFLSHQPKTGVVFFHLILLKELTLMPGPTAEGQGTLAAARPVCLGGDRGSGPPTPRCHGAPPWGKQLQMEAEK